MVALRGGAFEMGSDILSPNDDLAVSHPSHTATTPPFKIDVTEVTVDAYRRCVDGGVCSLPIQQPPPGIDWPTCTWFDPDRGNHPINCVTWYQADAYCKWAGKELPTEEMWEFAARGPYGREFPWGRRVPGQRWFLPTNLNERLQGSCHADNKRLDYETCPVGSAPLGATPEGVLDLAGNVREWTASPFCDYRGKKSCDQTVRVVRGGHNDWFTNLADVHSAYRSVGKLDSASPVTGFRCAKPGGA